MHNYDLIWPLFPHKSNTYLQDLYYGLINFLWNGSILSPGARASSGTILAWINSLCPWYDICHYSTWLFANVIIAWYQFGTEPQPIIPVKFIYFQFGYSFSSTEFWQLFPGTKRLIRVYSVAVKTGLIFTMIFPWNRRGACLVGFMKTWLMNHTILKFMVSLGRKNSLFAWLNFACVTSTGLSCQACKFKRLTCCSLPPNKDDIKCSYRITLSVTSLVHIQQQANDWTNADLVWIEPFQRSWSVNGSKIKNISVREIILDKHSMQHFDNFMQGPLS